MVGCPTKDQTWTHLKTTLHQPSLATKLHLENELLTPYATGSSWLPNFDPFQRPPLDLLLHGKANKRGKTHTQLVRPVPVQQARPDSFLEAGDLGLARSTVVLLAMLGHGHSSGTLSFCTPITLLFLSNAMSLFSLAVSFSQHALAPEVLPSHGNPNLMHISSFGCLIAASSPKIGVYKGTCCGFLLVGLAFLKNQNTCPPHVSININKKIKKSSFLFLI